MSVEIADIAVAEPLKTLRPGDKITVKVLRVDAKRQRIGLSIRNTERPMIRVVAASPDNLSAPPAALVYDTERQLFALHLSSPV